MFNQRATYFSQRLENSQFFAEQPFGSTLPLNTSRGSFLWLPRVYLFFFVISLLLAVTLSASPYEAHSQLSPLATFIRRSPGDDSLHYMKPSQFFNLYFDCRYKLPKVSSANENEDTVDGSHSDSESDIESRANELSPEWPQSQLPNGTWRHSKRQNIQRNRLQKKLHIHCPVDCDGVSKWPETPANVVHHISCLDVLRNTQAMLSNAINEGMTGSLQDEQNEGKGVAADENLATLDGTVNGPISIEGFMRNEKRLALGNATRRCTIDGIWELQADYSKCGFESRRLFSLTPQQLDKIYDIRESMISSKFSRPAQTEQAFINCVDDVLSQPPSQLPKPFCERIFDGWTCFNDTPAGHVVYFKCPDFIYGFNSQNEAHKTCNSDGNWKINQDTLLAWTNYTSCVDLPDLHFRNIIIKLHIIGYSISLLALLISLVIFISFKTLSSQTRIRIHKNFFVSFIINNFMWIIWYFAITDESILFENGLYCQSLHVLMHYFLVCNYFWMFCEGLYLHTILVVAFVSEEKILKWFYLIGWGIPVVFATAYASFRVNSPDAQNCWIGESKYTWILNVPVLLSFILNIFFLVNIVRVLVTKLQAVNTADTHQTRKAVRATLILIPLLGLHFILTPFRPESNNSAAQLYEVFSAMVSSLQGFCVAMLFCFFNGEVLSHLRKRWNQFLLVHGYGSDRRMSYGGTTVSLRLSKHNLNAPSTGATVSKSSLSSKRDSKTKNADKYGHDQSDKQKEMSSWKSTTVSDSGNQTIVSDDGSNSRSSIRKGSSTSRGSNGETSRATSSLNSTTISSHIDYHPIPVSSLNASNGSAGNASYKVDAL